MKRPAAALQPLITELDAVIAAARAARLEETAALLRIARLDLMMRAHGIVSEELELVSFALARGLCGAQPKPVRRKKRKSAR